MAARLNGLLSPILKSHKVYASLLNYDMTRDVEAASFKSLPPLALPLPPLPLPPLLLLPLDDVIFALKFLDPKI